MSVLTSLGTTDQVMYCSNAPNGNCRSNWTVSSSTMDTSSIMLNSPAFSVFSSTGARKEC
jgi:hypothetical protein